MVHDIFAKYNSISYPKEPNLIASIYLETIINNFKSLIP